MAAWPELRARLRRDFAIVGDEADELTITVEIHGKRAQRVMVHRYRWDDVDMIELRSAFGEEGEYDPAGLLADNLQIPLGAIAQHGRFLVLVQKTPLADITVDGVVFLATRVGLLADALEHRVGKDRF